jgi:hypothetical protein
VATKTPDNWLEGLLPLPRPEYAKQTEALLTDLLWRSPGSSLAQTPLFETLGKLQAAKGATPLDPERLILRARPGTSPNPKLVQTFPLAQGTDTATLVTAAGSNPTPTSPFLESLVAPRARGDKSDACVPVHPSLVALQTLHGLVNKQSPANLAVAIETMGWLGGAPTEGAVAAVFLNACQVAVAPKEGATGLFESLSAAIAEHVWKTLPTLPQWQSPLPSWPVWPGVTPVNIVASRAAPLSSCSKTPFAWFWRKWSRLTSPANRWHEVLPSRRFVDWSMCLLRTGLAFSYLWEAEFYTRLHRRVAERQFAGGGSGIDPIRSMLSEGALLATIEPPGIPASQKGIWRALADLLARGYLARELLQDGLGKGATLPTGATLADQVDTWVQNLSAAQVQELGAPLQVAPRTANNQKEFVRYLIQPRSSDDDMIDQADFYYLAPSNSRHTWFHPGPEWLVVVTSLLCDAPGGQCTLGELVEDLAALGIRVDRSVLVGMLEESGLSTDSPDADNALVIKSGF